MKRCAYDFGIPTRGPVGATDQPNQAVQESFPAFPRAYPAGLTSVSAGPVDGSGVAPPPFPAGSARAARLYGTASAESAVCQTGSMSPEGLAGLAGPEGQADGAPSAAPTSRS